MLAPFHRLMRRLLPADDDADDRPGAGWLHFDSDLFWIYRRVAEKSQPALAKVHDDMYEAVRRGETYVTPDKEYVIATLKDADIWLFNETKELVQEIADSFRLTPAQKRWGLLVGGLAYPLIRLRNILRGE